MTLSSFERALSLVASDEEQADVWYNIGHVAVVSQQIKEKKYTRKLTLCFCSLQGSHKKNKI